MIRFCTRYTSDSTPYPTSQGTGLAGFVRTMDISCTVPVRRPPTETNHDPIEQQ